MTQVNIKEFDTVLKRAVAICLAACLSIGLSAQANQSATPSSTKVEKTFGAWTVTCIENAGQKRCSLYERLGTQKKQLIFVWSVETNADKQMVNTLAILTGVSIKEGVRVSIGSGAARTVPYDVCTPRGCFATFPLDAATLQAMNASPQISANYVEASRKLVQLQIDLKDFPKAYEYFKSQL